tara:strand:- start:641 stop:1063 length:423 start_codon:yes stop_codon:yes gene_type:complete
LIKKLSDKDKKDWENFIKSDEKIFNKDLSKDKALNKKIITKTIDLHGLSLENANKIVSKNLQECFFQNIEKLIIITGKGLRSDTENNPYVSKDLSILKHSVPEFIKSNSDLMKIIKEIRSANEDEGGTGAFYIYLKAFKG